MLVKNNDSLELNPPYPSVLEAGPGPSERLKRIPVLSSLCLIGSGIMVHLLKDY